MRRKFTTLFITLLFIVFINASSAQICSGTMTTVWKDDFGSGLSQAAALPNSNITSGYLFQENGVHVGNYGIVNRFDYFGSWHIIPEDHTPSDSGGYFLVIDGNSAAPIFYDVVIQNICPFTQYSFSTAAMNIDLPVFPSDQTFTFIISDTLGNQVASWNSPPVTVTDSAVWVELGFSFNSGNNRALRFQVKFNETGYDDFAFDDFKFSVCGPALIITGPTNTTCVDSIPLKATLGSGYANPVYQWQKKNPLGNFENIPGATSSQFTDRDVTDSNEYSLLVGDGSFLCPTIVDKLVVISSVKKTTIDTAICSGANYQGYSKTGIYTDTFSISNGCDSIRTLNLIVVNCNPGKSIIINDYTAVTAFDPCTNTLTVKDAGRYKTGDTVLLIQMKGAIVAENNDSNFGTITSYNNAGNYEFNFIKNRSGNSIQLSNTLSNEYDFANGKVQLVRVPWFQTAVIADTLTCLPWDGEKGGIVALNAETVTLNAPVDVSKKGFRGGGIGSGFQCGTTAWAASTGTGGGKGEGIANYIVGREAGGARLSNGGGGAFSANAGAGGGSNFGSGGTGGYESNSCSAQQQGIAGQALSYTGNYLFAGGGGGGGQQDDGQVVTSGGNGGGIILINASMLVSNNQKISSNGESITRIINDEGGSGGGAGGSISLSIDSYSGNLSIETKGGSGSSNNNSIYPLRCHGPGGGGGGGYIAFSNSSIPAGISVSNTGGKAGTVQNPSSACYNTTNGASDGFTGGVNFSTDVIVDMAPFKKNIDSVKIAYINRCKKFDFTGTGFTNTSAVKFWQWDFGDNSSGSSETITHLYSTPGNKNVKLVIKDENGCKDSTYIPVIADEDGGSFVKTINDTTVCESSPVQLPATGGISYSWSPGTGLSDSTISRPEAIPDISTTYVVSGNDADGCVSKNTVRINVNSKPNINITNDTVTCKDSPIQLSADGGNSYSWFPTGGLDNPDIAKPIATLSQNTVYTVTVTNAQQCSNKDSVSITIRSPSTFVISGDSGVCKGNTAQLWATGGDSYFWSPSVNVSDPFSGNPLATINNTTTFSVKIKESVCNDSAFLTTTIEAIPLPAVLVTKSNDINCSTGSATLSATGGLSYSWTPSNTLNNSLSATTIASPVTTTTYTVTAADTSGCKSSKSIVLAVNFTGKANYYLPNAFTPNGDGINDCYGLKYFGLVEKMELIIYNRFGEKVFFTTNPNTCWNGTYKGKAASPGNYIYHLKAVTACGTVEKKGNLLIIR